MTDFTSLSLAQQYALTGVLFIAVLLVFFLVVYKRVSFGSFRRSVADIAAFILLFVFISYLSGSRLNGMLNYEIKLPFIVVVIISVAVIFLSIFSLITAFKKNKNELSPSSVKEALDNLNSGICFCDKSGRIVLINHIMGALFSSSGGALPQTFGEIENALESCTSLGNGLYRFSDSTVWLINTVSLEQENLSGFTQTAAQNVTELYKVTEQLKEDNKELKETNEKITLMLERLADRIREQETLELKMRIHDDIGTSLIAITNIMQGGADKTLEAQLAVLQNAVGYFSDEMPRRSDTFEGAVKDAESMGVELILSGTLATDERVNRLITLAARECVTNCIHHAKGSKVLCESVKNGSFYTVEFTNNGKKPQHEIIEGGGLSSLRKKIENFGGEMSVLHSPEFMLILKIPEKEITA